MNIRIVDEYSKNDNLNILKEECAAMDTKRAEQREKA